MDRNSLLGASFACDCGKQHTVPTKGFFYAPDALSFLPETAREINSAGQWLIIADTRTYEAVGREVEILIRKEGLAPGLFIVPDHDGETPAADDRTRDLLLNSAPDADLYIAVGSGVINDLVKWTAHIKNKPFITVATAASMKGYGSANVAETIDGLKVLFHATGCFFTPAVSQSSPF